MTCSYSGNTMYRLGGKPEKNINGKTLQSCDRPFCFVSKERQNSMQEYCLKSKMKDILRWTRLCSLAGRTVLVDKRRRKSCLESVPGKNKNQRGGERQEFYRPSKPECAIFFTEANILQGKFKFVNTKISVEQAKDSAQSQKRIYKGMRWIENFCIPEKIRNPNVGASKPEVKFIHALHFA